MQRRERSYNTHNMHNHNNKSIISARRKEKGEQAIAKGHLTSTTTSKWNLAFATKICRR